MKKFFILIIVVLVLWVGSPYFFKSSEQSNQNQIAQNSKQILEEKIISYFELEGFDGDGNQAWKLEGDKAHIYADQDVFIEKDVVLNLQSEMQVFSDKVLWQNTRSQFLTNQPVKVKHSDGVILGQGALGKLEERFVQINQNIEMLTTGDTRVTCHGPMKLFQNDNRVILYRDVEIYDKRGKIFSDELEGYFHPETKKLVLLIAKGNVVIQHEGDETRSDIAIYNTETKSVKLEGDPKIAIENINAKKEFSGINGLIEGE